MLIDLLRYQLLSSFGRQKLDKKLEEAQKLFNGKILNIGGGRKKGKFKFSDKTEVVVVDIDKAFNPDVIASVEKLPFKNESFDAVRATELFEHVENPKKGIGECVRVLKKGGYFVFSMPFLYPIHADPNDFQRWTEQKIRLVFKRIPIKIKKFEVLGYYFTVLADFIKKPILNLPFYLRYTLYILIFPLIYFLTIVDKKLSKNNRFLNKYHRGYFIVCKKV